MALPTFARAVVLTAAAVPIALAAAAAALRSGHWRLYDDRHQVVLFSQPRRNRPRCRGNGGWWTTGPFPDPEACGCWADRREPRIPLLRRPDPWPDEPPL